MNKMATRSFIVLLALGVFALTTSTSQARKEKTEDELVADLASPKDGVVTDAMQELEKKYPTSAKGIPAIKKLLTDPRAKVRIKAGRVLGAIHANVDETDLKNIVKMLKAPERNEVIDALKSLRGLKAQSTIPEILPLLKHENNFVKRDACRTLAVLGDKSLIPSIKPLLEFPDLAVQKDAADAIEILKAK
jgi:HEAT repeat protein